MSESGTQPDYFLHLDLGEGDIESQVHADGNGFLDFSASSLSDQDQDSQQATDVLQQDPPHQWAGVTIDMTKGTPLGDRNTAEPAFAGLMAGDQQTPLDRNENSWNSTEVHRQSYGSLMDMEIHQQMTPPEQNSGYITPDLIFVSSASRTAVAAPDSTESEPLTAATQKADTKSPTQPNSTDTVSTLGKDGTTRSRRSSGSHAVKESPTPAQTAPTGDIRRSGRARKPTTLAALSEEYVQSTQGTPSTTAAAVYTPERVTRSKKVYCYCQKPDDGEVMIQCDNCRQWFHGACVDITDEIAHLMELKDEKYFCDTCTETLKERSKTQFGGKTKHTKISDALDCALPTCLNEARPTSDYCSEECAIKGIELEAAQAVAQSEHLLPTIVIPAKKLAAGPSVKKSNLAAAPKSPISPKPEQDPVRSTALKGITDGLMVALEGQENQKPEDIEKAKTLAVSIEKELYLFTATPGVPGCGKDYKAKYRSLFFNLKDKNNDSLRNRVLSEELKPRELVRLTPEELANPELQSIAEEVRKRSIHDSVLTIDEEPFIKKTHKGEVSFVPRVSSIAGSKLEQEEEEEEEEEEKDEEQTADRTEEEKTGGELFAQNNGGHDGSNKSTPQGSPRMDTLDKLLARIQTNKRPGEEALNEVLSSSEKRQRNDSGGDRSSSGMSYMPREPSPYSPSPSPEGSPTLLSTTPPDSPPPFMLEEIRRNMEREKASDSKRATSAEPVWQGTLSMPQVAKFQSRAVQVGGRTIPGPEWADILARSISIDGRIHIKAVETYLTQVKQSLTKEVVLVRLEPSLVMDGPEDAQREFNHLCQHLHDISRFGVVPQKSGGRVKDLYLIPLAAGAPLPWLFEGLMESEAHVRGRDQSAKNALIGVLVLNKGSSSGSHHQQRGHSHQQKQQHHHHGHSPSQSKSGSGQRRPISKEATASAGRPYPIPQERREIKDSQQGRAPPPVHPGPPPPAPTTAYQWTPPTSAPVASRAPAPSPISTSGSAATTAGPTSPPLKVPSLQELQGLVNQLFPASNPSSSTNVRPQQEQQHREQQLQPPQTTGASSSQGLTSAAAAVTTQLTGSSAPNYLGGIPASMAMDLSQTLAQLRQQQHQQPPQQLPQHPPQPPPVPPFFGLHGMPPGFPLPPPVPPALIAAAAAAGQPIAPFPPIPPHQLQAFLSQQQQHHAQQPPHQQPYPALPYPPATIAPPRDPRQAPTDPRDPRGSRDPRDPRNQQGHDRRWDR
ncbi:hypothetical protein EMPS_04572 [Entomortierella parvispora]|uniref:Transcription factor BYE1 n=1 Tax=Entomortierella parvispora TaxID=205924 RepID=A0A9P3H8Y1_9FUNG|nr:hypothetical protein EMPS_04572 [Entomortierella parvispora]